MKKIRLSLDVTEDMYSIIEGLSEAQGVSKGEVLRRAIALFKAVKEAEKRGESAALVSDKKIVARLVGF